jgi:hypothetical protein
MPVHLSNADVIIIIGLSLFGSLLVATRIKQLTWPKLLLDALAVNALAIAAVVVAEALLA